MNLLPWRRKSAVEVARTPQDIEAMVRTAILSASNGIDVTHSNALQVPEVLACINVLAQSMSMLPASIYKKVGDGREKHTKHPVHKVISQKPNHFQSPLEFKRTMTFNAAWKGNAYAYKVMLGNRLLELIPIDVTPRQEADGAIIYRQSLSGGGVKDYAQDEIFHLRGPICHKGWVSESPVVTCRDSIATMMAINLFSSKYFKGGAKAKGAFRLPEAQETLGEEEYERLKSSLNDAAESDSMMLLEQGLDYLKMDYNARESQLSEMQDAQVSKICRLYRIQPHMIQALKDATFSNIEHQSREFVDHTLMPWILLWESAIKVQLMDASVTDVYPKVSAQALLRGDNKTRSEVYRSAVGAAYMTPNEARALEDMDAVEGGDNLLQPLNMVNATEESTDDPEETDPV